LFIFKIRTRPGSVFQYECFASTVFDLVEKSHAQQVKGFEELWFSKVIRSQADIFQDIFDQLTNVQRVVLQALAIIQHEGIISEDAREKYRLPMRSTLNEALKALQKKALINKSAAAYNLPIRS